MTNYDANVYQRFGEDGPETLEPQPSRSRTRNVAYMGVGIVAVLASASAYAFSGSPIPPMATMTLDIAGPSAQTIDQGFQNLIHQIQSVHDPKADICADPYAAMCGKFDREFVMPEGVPIETWGFNQVEDEMRRQSSEGRLSCKDAMARTDVDEWTAFFSCAFQLCERDGRYYEGKLQSPSTPNLLHKYAPETDTVIRQYLPIIRLTSEEVASIIGADDEAYRQFFAGFLGDLHNLGQHTLVKLHTEPDVLFENKSYNLKVEGGKLFYPNKDQYTDKTQMTTLTTYWTSLLTAHETDILGNPADNEAIKVRVAKVEEFEKALANIHLSEADKRDQIAVNNPGTSRLLVHQMNGILDLRLFVSRQGVPHLGHILSQSEHDLVFENPEFIDQLGDVLNATPRAVVLDYLLLASLNVVAAHLTPPLRNANAKWTSVSEGAMPGDTKETCQKWTADSLPWIIGRDIVRNAQGADIRRRLATQILTDLKEEYYNQVRDSWWMDDESKDGAYKKLDAMSQQVGWPKWLVDSDPEHGYSSYFQRFYLSDDLALPDLGRLSSFLLETGGDDKAAAFLRVSLELKSADHREIITRVGTSIDLGIWSMYPQDVNAEYFTTTNNFMLPWGVLQTPMMFVWSDGPYTSEEERMKNLVLKAASYGGVGSVTAHEIMHGFDDDGRTHDYNGQLKPLSTPTADKKFGEIIQCISDEYGSMTVEFDTRDGHKVKHLNGPMTQGENLADNGGLQSLNRLMLSGKVIPKDDLHKRPLTSYGIDTQLGAFPMTIFGTIWCEKSTSAYLENHAESDPHAPGDKRVIGVFSNLHQLGEYLQCPLGTVMNPEPITGTKQDNLNHRNQCRVW